MLEDARDGVVGDCTCAGGTGSEGTTVDRTTYGQYDRCSFSRSKDRRGSGFTARPAGIGEATESALAPFEGFALVDIGSIGTSVDDGAGTGLWVAKPHSPKRR